MQNVNSERKSSVDTLSQDDTGPHEIVREVAGTPLDDGIRVRSSALESILGVVLIFGSYLAWNLLEAHLRSGVTS